MKIGTKKKTKVHGLRLLWLRMETPLRVDILHVQNLELRSSVLLMGFVIAFHSILAVVEQFGFAVPFGNQTAFIDTL